MNKAITRRDGGVGDGVRAFWSAATWRRFSLDHEYR